MWIWQFGRSRSFAVNIDRKGEVEREARSDCLGCQVRSLASRGASSGEPEDSPLGC
jgi:hypothetical protein